MSNQLQFEKSPYLLQHKDNPVNWYPWSKEAFDAAISRDKPIFLSIGYSTCHWCHVMAHESFEDEDAAKILNREYISIKVDREERPDIDAVYMSACTAMNGSGGWPLTVLMSPDQKPFWTGTYLPKRQLMALLKSAAEMWREERETLLAAGDELTDLLQREEETDTGTPSRGMVENAVSGFKRRFDKAYGGFGRAPKFPIPHDLVFLLRSVGFTGDENALKMADKTLEAMYRGGIFDHIGGGFSRYSTDEKWLVPHFEKMLYDNALLTLAYTDGFKLTHRKLYKNVVQRTLCYVLSQLRSPDGGFYCGQDADSDGEEGKYYVFTPCELTEVLGAADAQSFCAHYGITEQGNFEGKNIPNLIENPDIDSEPETMTDIRRRLIEYRKNRTQLHRDHKILTSWNGLMIAALSYAGLALKEPEYLEAAICAVRFIEDKLTLSSGKLYARYCDGQAAFDGKLEDYAFYAWGLLELYAATFDVKYLTRAAELAKIMTEYFFDKKSGGFYPYASDGEQLIARKKDTYDGAVPSGNSVAALVFSRLARLTGDITLREIADKQLEFLAGAARNYSWGHSFAMLTFLEELWRPAELICTAEAVPHELLELLREEMLPELTVIVKMPENAQELAEIAPFTAEYTQQDKYYLCRNGACKAPVDTATEVKKLLGEEA